MVENCSVFLKVLFRFSKLRITIANFWSIAPVVEGDRRHKLQQSVWWAALHACHLKSSFRKFRQNCFALCNTVSCAMSREKTFAVHFVFVRKERENIEVRCSLKHTRSGTATVLSISKLFLSALILFIFCHLANCLNFAAQQHNSFLIVMTLFYHQTRK